MSGLPGVVIVTGASAAGKSTVAEALAQRISPSVHLRGDAFRKMIVNGRAVMGAPLSPAAVAQLELRYAIARAAARAYADAGFTVIYQDVILGPYLAAAVAALRDLSPGVVVLDPDAAAVAAREAGRGKSAYRGGLTPDAMVEGLRAETPRLGLWLDTSGMTVAETVDAILARTDETRAGV